MTAQTSAPVVCIGYGPAGIGLAAALTDLSYQPHREPEAAGLAARAVYLERRPEAGWQPELMLAGTDIQHHYLRDFGTPRDPHTRFGFVNYLHAQQRFYEFTQRSGSPERVEWDDYCRWVADRADGHKQYGAAVRAVHRDTAANGTPPVYRVEYHDEATGRAHAIRTPAVVVATGYTPHIPPEFEVGDRRIFHSEHYLSRVAGLDRPRSIAVVGAAQTAGEIILDLRSRFPGATVHSIVRNNGFSMYDLGHFVNRAYWPQERAAFAAYPAEVRAAVYAGQARTNYAAVDPDVSTALYNDWYRGRVLGEQRLHLHIRSAARIIDAGSATITVDITDRHTGGHRDRIGVDAVILCTGYLQPTIPEVLIPIADGFALDVYGEPVVDPAGQIRSADPGHESGVYLHGVAERQQGIGSAASFSLLAVRSGDLAESLVAATRSLPTATAPA
ncbi:SidA/IucD/PvdA family monooxygenase [Nocardia sp. alder85J]|uniref:SidA/IucD/PvdA family monooxygenase n=1 Tax=Nocardia sp. alder85J TaxID=2862949 RepID=UPI001CD71DB0|nr:SidA/IucD/PvdA family monooxygenase [Nocardia sp. alder85J]MCX4091978.1 SidA/IucD/PvdA family monooxygenase [Nocardia sp. alder85J]